MNKPKQCPQCGSKKLWVENTGISLRQQVDGKLEAPHSYQLAERTIQCADCGHYLADGAPV